MDNKETNVDDIISRIEELTDKLSISKYNLLKISFLIKLVEDTEKFAPVCEECRSNRKVLHSMIEEIPYLDDIVHRQPYERQFNAVRKHFHHKHGYIPLYYFISRWSLIGVALGTVFSFLISVAFNVDFLYDGLLIGLAIGLTVGYLWGSVKELKYRKSGKII